MERIKKAYLSSFANSLWFTIACFGFGKDIYNFQNTNPK